MKYVTITPERLADAMSKASSQIMADMPEGTDPLTASLFTLLLLAAQKLTMVEVFGGEENE